MDKETELQTKLEEAKKRLRKSFFALGVNIGSAALALLGPNYVREQFDGKINALKQNNPAVARVYQLEEKCYLIGDNHVVPRADLERYITDTDFVAEQYLLEKEHKQLMADQDVVASVKDINNYDQSAMNYSGLTILIGAFGMMGSFVYITRLRPKTD